MKAYFGPILDLSRSVYALEIEKRIPGRRFRTAGSILEKARGSLTKPTPKGYLLTAAVGSSLDGPD